MEPAFQTPIAFLGRISYTVATQLSRKVFCELHIHFIFVNPFIKIHLIPLQTIKKNIWDKTMVLYISLLSLRKTVTI